MSTITRRRFVQIAAALGASTAIPFSLHAKEYMFSRWQGIVMGADATLTLAHPNKKKAEATIQRCLKEIDRLENIFSLYRENSALVRLNKQAELTNPAPEFTELLTIAKHYGTRSNGLFDVTIQPLWQAYHEHFKQAGANEKGPSNAAIKHALQRVDYNNLSITPERIALNPGMAITLNGIAQGYITNHIAALLKAEGYENALVNLGEYQTTGNHPAKRDWRVGIADAKEPWKLATELNIPAGKAAATSSSYGTRWSARAHHLLSPKTGRPVQTNQTSVTVIADNATAADALSTLFSLLPADEIKALTARFPEMVEFTTYT